MFINGNVFISFLLLCLHFFQHINKQLISVGYMLKLEHKIYTRVPQVGGIARRMWNMNQRGLLVPVIIKAKGNNNYTKTVHIGGTVLIYCTLCH